VLESGGTVTAVFSSGSVLYAATGPSDLLRPGHTAHARPGPLRLRVPAGPRSPDATTILPTHGFGSFCASVQAQAESSTMGQEKQVNPVL
jgi:hypothetical protein